MTICRWGRWVLVAVFAMGASSVSTGGSERDEAAPPFAQTQWIAPPAGRDVGSPLPLLRKEFSVAGKPRRAALRIAGLGDYDPRVNGARLADTGINQPWSQYDSRWRIQDGTFHLTAQIPAGTAATAILPSGATKSLRSGLNDLAEPWK